ncbi:MAG: cation-translocating P-type ATPase, partial [Sphingobacteriaceae bacterium]
MQKNTIHKIYPVTGMSCASCAMSVESIATTVPGVQQASVNFATQALDIYFNPEQTNETQIQKAIENVGFGLLVDEDNAFEQQQQQQLTAYNQLKKQTLGAVLLTIPVVVLDMIWMDWKPAHWIMLFLSTIILFGFGSRFFVNAWKQAVNGRANMDSLVAISTGVAYVFSLFNV